MILSKEFDPNSVLRIINQLTERIVELEKSASLFKKHAHGEADAQHVLFDTLFGLMKVSDTIPTYAPKTISQQIVLYSNGGFSAIYVYDTSTASWMHLTPPTIVSLLNSAGLTISSGKKLVKIATAFYYLINGQIYTQGATESGWDLVGTVVNGDYNVFVLAIDATTTRTAYMGTAYSSLESVVFPNVPQTSAVVGFVIVHPIGAGNFVGGTTNLDSGVVIPNAVYVNTPWPFNPNALTLS